MQRRDYPLVFPIVVKNTGFHGLFSDILPMYLQKAIKNGAGRSSELENLEYLVSSIINAALHSYRYGRNQDDDLTMKHLVERFINKARPSDITTNGLDLPIPMVDRVKELGYDSGSIKNVSLLSFLCYIGERKQNNRRGRYDTYREKEPVRYMDLAKELIEAGANPNSGVCLDSRPPIFHFVEDYCRVALDQHALSQEIIDEHLGTLKRCVENGSPLVVSVDGEKETILKPLFLLFEQRVEARLDLWSENSESVEKDYQPLIYPEEAEFIKLAIQHGADPNMDVLKERYRNSRHIPVRSLLWSMWLLTLEVKSSKKSEILSMISTLEGGGADISRLKDKSSGAPGLYIGNRTAELFYEILKRYKEVRFDCANILSENKFENMTCVLALVQAAMNNSLTYTNASILVQSVRKKLCDYAAQTPLFYKDLKRDMGIVVEAISQEQRSPEIMQIMVLCKNLKREIDSVDLVAKAQVTSEDFEDELIRG